MLRYRLRALPRRDDLPRKSIRTKGAGKRYPLNMRTTKEVRELLEREAAKSGRSLVQEVEHRIELSFRDDSLFKFVGGTDTELVIRPLLYFLGLVQGRMRDWQKDPEIAEAVSRGISLIAEAVLTHRHLSTDRQTALLLNDHNDAAREVTSAALAILQALGFTEKRKPEKPDHQ